jgi:restriction system protein
MPREQSKSQKLATRVIFEALKVLKENGGSLKGFEVVNILRQRLIFNEWESERYEKTGYIRWESILHFFTIDLIKAGFLQKNKGTWLLTPEGEEALKLGPEKLFEASRKAYRDWTTKRKPEDEKTVEKPMDVPETEASFEQEQKALLDQYEEKAYEGLRNFVLTKNPYEFQDLVAGLLATMGYYISHNAPRGRDGGIDIIAYTDPLGTKPPRIIVQVKHRPDSKVPSDDIQRLIGTMKRESDVGIFVSSGEFSQPAILEARLSGKHVELIDFDRFIDLWTKYYDKMNDDQKNMLPLHPIYFLGSNE